MPRTKKPSSKAPELTCTSAATMLAAHSFCQVCFKTKHQKYYCADHTLKSTETDVLRWAKKINPEVNSLIRWSERKVSISCPELLTNPAKTLYETTKSMPLDALKHYFGFLVYSNPQSNLFEISKHLDRIDASAKGEEYLSMIGVLFSQLTLIGKVLSDEMRLKMMTLLALTIKDFAYLCEHTSDQAMPHAAISLPLFFRAWFSGFKPHDTSTPAIAPPSWIGSGFDPLSTIAAITEYDAPDATPCDAYLKLLLQTLIRQSACMQADIELRADPEIGKLDAKQMVEWHYIRKYPFDKIGARINPSNPVSESTVKMTIFRQVAANINAQMWEEAKAEFSAQTGIALRADNDIQMVQRKKLGEILSRKMGYAIPLSSYVVTLWLQTLS